MRWVGRRRSPTILTVKRPLPLIPRGPRRKRVVRARMVFGCPRVSPEWALGTPPAVMEPRPRTGGAVGQRDGAQAGPAGADGILGRTLAEVRDRLGTELDVH